MAIWRENTGHRTCAIVKLRAAGITTTFQLFGHFLSLRSEHVSPEQHCRLFFEWLKSVGINAHRTNIVACIAEKNSILFSGLNGIIAEDEVTYTADDKIQVADEAKEAVGKKIEKN